MDRLIERLSNVVRKYPMLTFSDIKSKGGDYSPQQTIVWVFDPAIGRSKNVLMEIYCRKNSLSGYNFVIQRYLLNSEENRRADNEDNNATSNERADIRFPNMSQEEMLEYVDKKLAEYINRKQ